jgi:S1-C subfamily serine protease
MRPEPGPRIGAATDRTVDAVVEEEDAAVLDAYSNAVVHVAERVTPSVASLRRKGRGPDGAAAGPSAGSAVSLTEDGFLVTSAHVVRGAEVSTAVFPDGREVGVRVVGADPLSDLAVLRADRGGLVAAHLGDADRLRVGQLVIAVGSPLGYEGSVSAGVVSGLGRSLVAGDGRHQRVVEQVIQTDAALHPGNSGGALADGAGRVVGINTAVVGPGIGQGLGLAVPVNPHTRAILGELMAHGSVRRAWLGIGGGTRPLPPRVAGETGRSRAVGVTSVATGSPAAAAGVRPGDLLVELAGRPVAGIGDLQRLLTAEQIGRPAPATLVRDGRVLTVEITPAALE